MTMGTQFRIAADKHDERLLCEFLRERWQALCASRFLDRPVLNAVSAGECESAEQIVFPADLLELIQSRVIPLSEHEGEFQVYPKAGVCLEWTRAEEKDGAVIPGRFYLNTRSEDDDLKRLKAMMKSLANFVRKQCPLVSKDKLPIFIGPNLASRVSKGDARVLYPGGSLVPLEAVKK
ncbi:hypothetical protein [Myxococcus sp. Y35]|uniref:hypothetical protein n=1 Tax=Pseudomyxococcus flavus TaxID=3115648 RepID=UPI003CEED83C